MKRAKPKKRVRTVRGWKKARAVLERWRRASASIEVELRAPRDIEVAPIDYLRGERIEPAARPQRVFRARLLDVSYADLVLRRRSGSLLVADLYEIASLSDGKVRVEPA